MGEAPHAHRGPYACPDEPRLLRGDAVRVAVDLAEHVAVRVAEREPEHEPERLAQREPKREPECLAQREPEREPEHLAHGGGVLRPAS